MNENLKEIMEKLNVIQEKLEIIGKLTNIHKKMEIMKLEIMDIGWNGILNKYHPDINCEEPASNEIFNMYKILYDIMKSNGEI